jgi:hypothetical protein
MAIFKIQMREKQGGGLRAASPPRRRTSGQSVSSRQRRQTACKPVQAMIDKAGEAIKNNNSLL